MAWESRGNASYLYRKVRVAGKVQSEYVGRGFHAEFVAMQDAAERQQAEIVRNAEREERRQQDAYDREINRHSGKLRTLVSTVLVASGYHQHKRQWRRKRMIKISCPPELSKALQADDMPALQAAMVRYPAAAAQLGNLSLHMQDTIVRRMFGEESPGVSLVVLEHARQMKAQLGYADSNAIEQSMIDHAVTCWLRLSETESRYESLLCENGVTLTRQEHWERRLSMAQNRYLKSVESLAKVRRLLSGVPLMQINVNSQVANVGTVQR